MNSSLSSNELAELMACADVYVSPYKAEGFNLPVLESMALGVPVIVTKGGPTDDFVDATFAKYVDSERVPGSMASIADLGQDLMGYELQADVTDLATHMTAAMHDPEWRMDAGRMAAEHAHAKLTWEKVTRDMIDGFEAF